MKFIGILAGIILSFAGSAQQLNCDVLQEMRKERKYDFGNVEITEDFDKYRAYTNYTLIEGDVKIYVYHYSTGFQLTHVTPPFDTSEEAIAFYKSVTEQMQTCLGERWTYAPVKENPRPRDHRTEFKPGYGEKGSIAVSVIPLSDTDQYEVRIRYD